MSCVVCVCAEYAIEWKQIYLHLYLFIASTSTINYCMYAGTWVHRKCSGAAVGVFVNKWINWCVSAERVGLVVNSPKLKHNTIAYRRSLCIAISHIRQQWWLKVAGGHHASTIINKYGSEFIWMHEYFMCAASTTWLCNENVLACLRVCVSYYLVTEFGCRLKWRAQKRQVPQLFIECTNGQRIGKNYHNHNRYVS